MKTKQRSPQWKKLTKECWGGNNGQSASERDRNMTTEHNRQLESENNASRRHLPLHSSTFSPSHIYPEDFGWQQQGPHHSPSLLQGNSYNYASSSVPMEGPVLHIIYPLHILEQSIWFTPKCCEVGYSTLHILRVTTRLILQTVTPEHEQNLRIFLEKQIQSKTHDK